MLRARPAAWTQRGRSPASTGVGTCPVSFCPLSSECASSSSTPKPPASTRSRGTGSSSSPRLELVDRRPTGRTIHFYVDPEREIDAGRGRSPRHDLGRPQGQAPVRRHGGRFRRLFARGAEWVIHNAPFDLAFLDAEFRRAGLPGCATLHAGVIDTLALARESFPGKRNNLNALCERFGVDNAHRTLHGALLDAAAPGRGVPRDDARPGDADHRLAAAEGPARRGGCGRRGAGERRASGPPCGASSPRPRSSRRTRRTSRRSTGRSRGAACGAARSMRAG